MARILRLLRCAIVLLIAESTMVNFRVLARAMSTVAKSFETHQVVLDVASKAPGAVATPMCTPSHLTEMFRKRCNITCIVYKPTHKDYRVLNYFHNEFLFSFVVAVVVLKATMSLVAQAFTSSKIVPDVVPTPPTVNIELKYPSGVIASQGNELTPTQVKDQPSVSFAAEANSYYTLVFTDPDNYDGPEKVYREWHHWLVVNIPGSDVSKGEVLSGYIGSGPPEGTGIHRYVYIVYKQPGKLTFDEKKLDNKSIDGRAAFSTNKFAEKYNLGSPVAGNFYRAQFDEYVPLLYKSLGA